LDFLICGYKTENNIISQNKSSMKEIVKFLICIILLIVIWNNFGKIVSIGNTIVDKVYTTIVK